MFSQIRAIKRHICYNPVLSWLLMNDDLVGIGGLLGYIVLLVLYALAIGVKTKQQPSKPLKPIQPRSTPKIVTPRAVDPAYERHLREVMEWARKGPKRPDFSTRHTDPDFWKKCREW